MTSHDDLPPSQRWLISTSSGWQTISAAELLSGFEEGRYSGEQTLKAGERSAPKALRSLIRELVWSSREEVSEDRSRSAQYYELVDHAPIPTALSDLGGRLTYVNQAFCDFLGYEREEVIGMTVGALSHPDDHKAEVTQGNRLISRGQGGFQMEKRYLTKGGQERVGLLSISMLHNEGGEPYAVLAQISDLSERQEMERRLTRSRTLSALGEMAQRVTHDLKNILMVLRGTLDLMQVEEERLKPSDRALICDGIIACESGDKLVRSLLEFKLSEEPWRERLTLSALLRSVEGTLKRSASPVSLTLSIDPQLEQVELWGQALWVERMLLNLVINGRQAIEATGRPLDAELIRVTLRPLSGAERFTYHLDDEAMTLEVSDSGVGIAAEMTHKILEPYVSTRQDQGGHGLGLSTVWSLCDLLGGILHIESELGVGSSFCLLLPKHRPNEEPREG